MRINGWVAGCAALGLLVGCAQDNQQVRSEPQVGQVRDTPPPSAEGPGQSVGATQVPEEEASTASRDAPADEAVTVAPPPLEGGVQVGAAVSGTVIDADEERVRIRDPEGNVYRLEVDEQSFQSEEGGQAQASQLSEGEPVRASFVLQKGDMFLREIEALDQETWKAEQEAVQSEGGQDELQ